MFKATDLHGVRLAAMDGPIGEVEDLFFDDELWTVRYLVVNTGGWLSGRHVLISPASVQQVDIANGRVIVILTRQQVQDSPDVDAATVLPKEVLSDPGRVIRGPDADDEQPPARGRPGCELIHGRLVSPEDAGERLGERSDDHEVGVRLHQRDRGLAPELDVRLVDDH